MINVKFISFISLKSHYDYNQAVVPACCRPLLVDGGGHADVEYNIL